MLCFAPGSRSPGWLEVTGRLAIREPREIELEHPDASEIERLRTELERAEDELTLIAHVSHSVASSLDPETVFDAIADGLHALVDFHAFRLLRYDPTTDSLYADRIASTRPEYRLEVLEDPAYRIPVGTGLTGWAARERKPVLCRDVAGDPRTLHVPGSLKLEESMVLAPILHEGELLGVLQIAHLGRDSLTERDLRVAVVVAGQAGVAMSHARTFEIQRESARRLEDLTRRQMEFILLASHELRGPLTVIQGHLSMWRDGTIQPDGGMAGASIKAMESAAAVLGQQVENILHLVRLDQAVAETGEVVDAASVIRDEFASVEGEAVEVVVDSGTAPIRMDRGLLVEAVSQLVSNGTKFNDREPHLLLTVRAGEKVEVTVADNGIGIPDDQLNDVFDPFVRVDVAAMRHVGGSGLGLYLVRRIVQTHGGEVWARRRPGGGSEVGFWLPRADPAS
jgi:signal transduction histidine kinase